MTIPQTLLELGQTLEYERRITVFFDVLGWRELVRAADNDPARIGAIAAIPRAFASLAAQRSNPANGPRLTTFSDCVVFSTPYVADELVFRLQRLAQVQLGLLTVGVYIRGGITVGQLAHDELLVFGPAMNRAYELESRHAVMPRLLFDPALPQEILDNALPALAFDEMDGFYYVDPFSKQVIHAGNVSSQSEEVRAELERHFPGAPASPLVSLNEIQVLLVIRHFVELARSQSTDTGVVAKYNWLANKIDHLLVESAVA